MKIPAAEFQAMQGRKPTKASVKASPAPIEEPLMCNQLTESEIRQVFDKISIPKVWEGLSTLGYKYVNADAEKLTVSNGKQTFELTIKQVK